MSVGSAAVTVATTATALAGLVPTDFAFGGHEMICHDSVPFNLVEGDIVNFTLRYEAT